MHWREILELPEGLVLLRSPGAVTALGFQVATQLFMTFYNPGFGHSGLEFYSFARITIHNNSINGYAVVLYIQTSMLSSCFALLGQLLHFLHFTDCGVSNFARPIGPSAQPTFKPRSGKG